MKLLEGKKGLILGVLNDKSIAWGIAKACREHGAEIALTYLGDAGKKRVVPLAEEIGSNILMNCDVSKEEDMDAVFAEIEQKWGKLDFMVHAVAFSDKNELRGYLFNTSMKNFDLTMNISCYSLIGLTKRAKPLMEKAGGGNIVALTYLGGERIVPHYNVMGVAKAALDATVRGLAAELGDFNIRVNAISSGPVRTLAASGIGGFNYMLKYSELNTPTRRNTSIEENGSTAVYLLSDMSSNVTGEVVHVDGGYHVVGMKDPKTPNLDIPEEAKADMYN